MPKHILLSPKQISKFTRSGKTKPTLHGRYLNYQVCSEIAPNFKKLKQEQKRLATVWSQELMRVRQSVKCSYIITKQKHTYENPAGAAFRCIWLEFLHVFKLTDHAEIVKK